MARIQITSALPYINGVKHLGTLAGSQLPADVYARFQRSRGHETLYICATDEHGTPAELAAAEARQDILTYCETYHRLQHDLLQPLPHLAQRHRRSDTLIARALVVRRLQQQSGSTVTRVLGHDAAFM